MSASRASTSIVGAIRDSLARAELDAWALFGVDRVVNRLGITD